MRKRRGSCPADGTVSGSLASVSCRLAVYENGHDGECHGEELAQRFKGGDDAWCVVPFADGFRTGTGTVACTARACPGAVIAVNHLWLMTRWMTKKANSTSPAISWNAMLMARLLYSRIMTTRTGRSKVSRNVDVHDRHRTRMMKVGGASMCPPPVFLFYLLFPFPVAAKRIEAGGKHCLAEPDAGEISCFCGCGRTSLWKRNIR